MSVDRYSYWMRALAITQGKRPLTREEMSGLGISEDEVGCGFYRMRAVPREPFSTAVAIWEAGPMTVASVDGRILLGSGEAIWTSACKYPIHEAAYRARLEGKKWPDEIKEETTT